MKRNHQIAWNPHRGAVESAREVLPRLATELFEAGRLIASADIKIKALHRFRLRVKRFRYTIELFQPLYGPALETRLSDLKALQDALGLVNDCSTARGLVVGAIGKKSAKAKRLLEWIGKEEQRRVAKFLDCWREKFDSAGQEARWVSYLHNYAGGRGTAKEPTGKEERQEPASERFPEADLSSV